MIAALKDLICSENNTAYLDREMILGILRSDNRELHKLIGGLLLAARLQEGLRQVICETMDEGTAEAFLTLLQVIEENDLIRFSSVKYGDHLFPDRIRFAVCRQRDRQLP